MAGADVGATSRMRTEDPIGLLSSIECKIDEFSQRKKAISTTVGPRTTIAGIADGLLTEQERLAWAAKPRIHAIISGCQPYVTYSALWEWPTSTGAVFCFPSSSNR